MTISRTTTASASRARSVSNKARLGLGTALALTLAGLVQADTLPTGGQVVHGTAQINTPAPGNLAIHQQSNQAIVNWDSFSIGQGNRVDITQPSADAAILNRVTGEATSQIHGQLNANGRVFVVNPNGVFIGKTGAVNAGSFVASTLDIRNDDFVTGKLVFQGDGNSATVSNAGTVQVVTGGYAALIGGKVKNSGTIQAPLGFVGLGAGERVTLDLAGDGFLQVAIPSDSEDDGLEALIENSGTIQANGGTVQISAATARNAARHAINMSGVVEARTVSGRNGRVTLGGGGGGKVTVSGKVRTRATRPTIQVTQSARPTARPARGGDITITGREIALAGATLDASGTDGGGSIRVGGELQGGPGLPTADFLTVDAGTLLTADALGTGDGGRVIAWSDLSTDFNGNISVRGGQDGGDGGFAEVSGKQDLRYNGFTDALAPKGAPGDLLLDPADIEIVAGAVAFNQILDTDLEAQLAGANVLIGTSIPNLPNPLDYPSSGLGFGEQPGDLGTITVTATADVAWNSGTSLTLLADQDIILNGSVTPNNGTLNLDAGGRVVMNGAVSAVAGLVDVDAGADFTIAGSGTLDVSNGTLTSIADDIEIDGTFIGQNATSTFEASNDVLVENANVFNGIEGNTTLEGNNVVIARELEIDLGVLDVLSGTATVTPVGSITGANGQSRISTAGPITLDGPILTPGGETRIIAFNATATPGTGGQVQTGLFELGANTTWQQNALGGPLAGFDATNFVLSDPTSRFLRVLDGDGTAPATAFEVTDIYGLQGVGSLGTGATWQLANGIDASPTLGWSSLAAPVNGQVDQGFEPLNFSGTLLGNRFTISDLFARRFGSTADGRAGLFNDLGSTAFVTQFNLANVDLAGATVGGVAASNDGTVLGVSVTGQLQVFNQDFANSFGGGVVALNNAGTIAGVISDVTITDIDDPSAVMIGASASHRIGGIAAQNGVTADIVAARSSGNISYDNATEAFVGGIVGQNLGDVRDAYSDATVTGTPGDAASIGSISGDNAGELINVIATGPVSLTGGPGSGGIGAVTGTDNPIDTSIVSSFFSVAGTGQTLSGQVGETTGFSPGIGQPFEGAIPDAEVNPGDTFVLLTDADAFTLLAGVSGWDFQNVWAFPQDGVDQARLVAIDPVIGANNQPTATPEVTYAGTGTDYTATDSVFSGGPSVYLFGPVGDTGNLNDMDSQLTLSDTDAGAQTYRYPLSYTSDLGQIFDVRSFDQDLTVNPAPLTVTVGNIQKNFGTELTFADVPLTAGPFFDADGITDGLAISDGAPANAAASDTPYPLTVTNLTGPGLANYVINIVPGTVQVLGETIVELLDLEVILNNATKTYGDALAFAGDEFVTVGLQGGDTLTSLTITSAGADPTAPVADSPYVIDGSDPVGTGLENYSINIIPGELTVVPAPLTITADDQSKPFGSTFTFTGTEFTVTGLLNSDTVESATLTSAGAAAEAEFTGEAGVAIVITDPVGLGLENYAVTLVNGIMVIAPGNLTITANDQTKLYGSTLTFDGTEFTVEGLAEGDSVDSVTLTSLGAVATAQVGDGPFTITPSAAIGTGLEKYTLVFADGSLTVVPAPLTVTANDQFKPQGFALSFDGTEFTTAGLVNGDTVDSAVLTSAGADAAALAADGPFAISVGALSGTGLANYEVSTVDGTLTVENVISTRRPNPIPPGSSTISNPPDTITIAFPGSTGNATRGVASRPTTGPGGAQQSLPDAQATFEYVDSISTDLEIAVQSCGNADQDFTNYMSCLSDSLDTFATALDQITNDLPQGLETVSATIRTAADEVRAAQARAARRLAGATTEAQRRAIRRDAVAEARGAIGNAQAEIRKAISLIRADDPGVQAVQEQTGARITQAFATVDTALARATDL